MKRQTEPVLEIRDLHTSFLTGSGTIPAVRGVDLRVDRGECLGVVGESGSGKSVTFLSVLRLLASTGRIIAGDILFEGRDLTRMTRRQIREVRGCGIAMIFQDPMSSLNPLLPIGDQVSEMLWAHDRSLSRSDREAKVVELLRMVRIPEAEKRLRSYPHEFSGGMRQRVMIAMALACRPSLLIADEPTTALDVSIQDQILKLMRKLQADLGMSIAFITHDLGVVAELCSRVIVMYGGLVMEEAPIDDLFEQPLHPYTQGLLASIPDIRQDKSQRLRPIPGSPPDMSRPPEGCPFAPRCHFARYVCVTELPPVTAFEGSRSCRCWLCGPDAPATDNPFRPVPTGIGGAPA
ncbi:MAG: ABC transporter ATP-binding protein [Clostridia bacterium]|nr:ABC transporter ATP-binding protein [Clostridia bacterium]